MTDTGPDVSSFQAGISGQAVRDAGHSFLIVKATQGTSYVNPALAMQVASARAAGLVVGMYHFLDGSDPTAQAQFFMRVAEPLMRPGDLPLIFDYENNPGGFSPSHGTLDTMRRVVRAAGHRTMTYTYPNWWVTTGDRTCQDCAGDPLWLASYGPQPVAPAPWGSWAMWQFSSSNTSVQGVGLIDMSTTDRLASLTTSGGNTMTPDQSRELAELHDGALTPLPAAFITDPAGHPLAPAQLAAWAGRWALINEGGLAKVSQQLDRLKEQIAALPVAPAGSAAPVDLAAVTAAADAGAAAAVERLLAAHVVVTLTPPVVP